jgi:transcriptional antiterminator RfaH
VRPRRGREDAPLFPGYLFLRYDLEGQGWRLLQGVPEVMGLVAFDGVVPPVPDEVITELKENVEVINDTGGLWTRFQPGTLVGVRLGPSGHMAQVVEEAKSPRHRVRVLLEFLGQLVCAEVPWKDVWQVGVDGSVEPVADTKDGVERRPRRTRGKGRYIKGFGQPASEPW